MNDNSAYQDNVANTAEHNELATIQSHHQREQISSSNGQVEEAELPDNKSKGTSLITESGIDIDSK